MSTLLSTLLSSLLFLRKWLIQKEVLSTNDGSEHAIGILVLCGSASSTRRFLEMLDQKLKQKLDQSLAPYLTAFHGSERKLIRECLEHKVIQITNYSTMSSRNRMRLQHIMERHYIELRGKRYPMQTVFLAIVDDLSFLKNDSSTWKNWVVHTDELPKDALSTDVLSTDVLSTDDSNHLLDVVRECVKRQPGETHYLNREETMMACNQFK